ncbi:hypothetical protein GCM10007972_15990 [Iodidimonas muriae]|uniref:RidA family protein n=1 Tax=Iodidimonas muriae TaxID=261467 RepID=A0ABQ2LDW0_9PROT|nr:RidA family protein [Iodidimonas muriae]GER07936.1 hypothetical protein JCM17843_22460 [Kordiimonadales bacterium JCM 17843]GGO11832.1 hypothetical protein GCM10007972_15990 [Iodidimonas muriae]
MTAERSVFYRLRSAGIAVAFLVFGGAAFLPFFTPSALAGPTYFAHPDGLPFSEAVRVGDILYLSGQIGAKPGALTLVPGGISAQARQAMENMGATLKRHGLSYDDLFKCTVMLADMGQWAAFNSVYVTYFKPDRLPARSAFGTSGLALGGALEIECWAYAGDDVAREGKDVK